MQDRRRLSTWAALHLGALATWLDQGTERCHLQDHLREPLLGQASCCLLNFNLDLKVRMRRLAEQCTVCKAAAETGLLYSHTPVVCTGRLCYVPYRLTSALTCTQIICFLIGRHGGLTTRDMPAVLSCLL